MQKQNPGGQGLGLETQSQMEPCLPAGQRLGRSHHAATRHPREDHIHQTESLPRTQRHPQPGQLPRELRGRKGHSKKSPRSKSPAPVEHNRALENMQRSHRRHQLPRAHPTPVVPPAPDPPPRLPPVHWRRGRQLCEPLCQPYRQPPPQTCATLLPSHGLGPVGVGGLGPGPPRGQHHAGPRHPPLAR